MCVSLSVFGVFAVADVVVGGGDVVCAACNIYSVHVASLMLLKAALFIFHIISPSVSL